MIRRCHAFRKKERRRIVELSLQEYSQSAISSITNRQLKTVNRIIEAERTERRVKEALRMVRVKVTTEHHDVHVDIIGGE